jgi:hypothetical protein
VELVDDELSELLVLSELLLDAEARTSASEVPLSSVLPESDELESDAPGGGGGGGM